MISLKDLVLESANGVSKEVSVPMNGNGLLELDVRAKAGTTPTLDVVIQAEVSGKWFQLAKFSQYADTTGVKIIPLYRNNVYTAGEVTLSDDPSVTTGGSAAANTCFYLNKLRVKWSIGGSASPTFTFAVRLHPVP